MDGDANIFALICIHTCVRLTLLQQRDQSFTLIIPAPPAAKIDQGTQLFVRSPGHARKTLSGRPLESSRRFPCGQFFQHRSPPRDYAASGACPGQPTIPRTAPPAAQPIRRPLGLRVDNLFLT